MIASLFRKLWAWLFGDKPEPVVAKPEPVAAQVKPEAKPLTLEEYYASLPASTRAFLSPHALTPGVDVNGNPIQPMEMTRNLASKDLGWTNGQWLKADGKKDEVVDYTIGPVPKEYKSLAIASISQLAGSPEVAYSLLTSKGEQLTEPKQTANANGSIRFMAIPGESYILRLKFLGDGSVSVQLNHA